MTQRIGKSAWIFGLVLIILFGSVLIIPHRASAQYIPSVTLTFPASQQAEVYPGANGTAVFSGKLTISCNYATSTVISVKSQSAGTEGWSVAISPCGVSCEPGTNVERDVTVTVWVPPETKQMSGNIELLAETKTTTPGVATSNEGGATIQVQVKPYYMLSVGCAVPYKEVGPGTEVSFDIDILNLGNAVGMFKVEIQDKADLIDEDWIVPETISSLRIESKAQHTLTLKFNTPREWTLWKDTPQEIRIKIISEESQKYVDFSVFVRQKGTYIPGFEPALLVLAICLVAVVLRNKKSLIK